MNPRIFFALLCLACFSSANAVIQPGYYSAPGMDKNRDYLNQSFSEYIDPFTGRLQLHYVDLELPGNGGLDLTVRRSYTDIQYTQGQLGDINVIGTRTPWGMGWTMHFGRVLSGNSNACARGSLTSTTDNPVLEMPDGHRELLFDAWTANSSGPQYLTAGRWKADCATDGSLGLVVTSPEGVRYDMTVRATLPMGMYTEYAWYVSKITDRNGNTISFSYVTNPVNYLLLKSISASDGRSVAFTYADESNSDARLTSVASAGRTWTYGYAAVPGLLSRYYLTQVTRPGGGSWNYAYNGDLGATVAGSYSLNKVTYPTNGTINYTYKFTQFNLADPYNESVTVARKTAAGDTWTFTYNPGTSYDVTTVATPAGTLTYRHFGISAATDGTVWRIGLLLQKTTGSLQTESYSWGSQVISNENASTAGWYPLKQDTGSRAAVLTNKTITRDGTPYSSTYSSFDAYGNPGRLIESGNASRTTDFTYHIDTSRWIVGQPKNETIAGIGSIARTFTSNGNLASESRYGVPTTYSYFSTGDLNTVTDARGHIWTYSSYSRGVPRSEQRPEGVSLSRTVDNAGNITAETNGEGYTTTFSYDGIDRLTGIGFPTGSPVTVTWGTTTRSVARGAYTESVIFDGFARPVSITRGGIATTASYDSLGRKIFESYPGSGNGTSFEWDILGRMKTATHPDTALKRFVYASGNKTTITNERNFVTTYTHRSFGDPDRRVLAAVTTPVTAAGVTITRNLLDLPTAVTQNGLTRTYGYDSRFFLTSITNPETGTTVFGRDAVGNLSSRKVGTSNVVNFAYDGLGRLKTITYPTGTPSVTQTWSGTGKPKSVTSSAASRLYTYDANDNLSSESLAIDGRNFTVAYGIDSLDHISSITYPSNRVVNYAPDALGWPTSVAPYVTTVSHHPSGQVSGIAYANGVTSSASFNSRNWPSSYTVTKGVSLVNRTYGYDAAGNQISISDVTDPTSNRVLGFDAIDRLTSASGPWGSGTIAYDGDGDITSQVLGSFSLSYGYDGSNRLSSISGSKGHTFSYDAYGNVTGNGVSSFSYDDAPVLRCANCASNPIQYTYDGQNVQVKTQKGALVNYSLYASNGDLLGIYDAAGAPIKEYAYLAGKQVAMYTASGGAATSYHLDPAGSPVAATDATGALLWREAYRPYGERLKVQDGGTNTLWFAGKVQDLTTGLSYLGARYYDPAIGRFMAVDPVGFAEQNLHSFNRYGYANNNPYKFVDPDGRAADLIVDLGFIGYGIYKLATEPSWTNAAALGGDVLGAAVPFVTGVGSGIRAAAHADDAADLLRGADAAGDGAMGAAQSAANAVRLEKRLASRAQMGEVGEILAGAGSRTVFRDAQRIAQQYGGNATDWAKKTSSSYLSRDGTRFETHWVENIRTGQRVEHKTKFPGGD